MRQLFSTTKISFYELQPGDATRYAFFWANIPEIFSSAETTKDNKLISVARAQHLFSGWGGSTYLLGLCIADKTRIAFLDRWAIDHWKEAGEWRLDEIASTLKSSAYTAKVLLAALSVLVAEPDDVQGACQAMIAARETML